MEIKQLEEQANEFVKTVCHPDSSEIQKSEMKKAYVSGLIDGYRLATNVGLLDLSEDEISKFALLYKSTMCDVKELFAKDQKLIRYIGVD